MGLALSLSLFHQPIDSKTGLKLRKVLNTPRTLVTSLRIQPSGNLLAAGDESGNLLIFDLSTEAVRPHHSRPLNQEQGGISELCWIGDDVIAVGTTRGKIITFSCKNKTERFFYAGIVEAHGDGVSQIAVETMTYLPQIRCLASVGEGKISIMLWNVDKDGKLSPHATGEQTTEFAVPRFVAFAENGAEIIVGYLEQALVKRFAIQPWKLLNRITLSEHDEHGAHSGEGCLHHYIGSATLLPRTRELAVFNLQNGLDIYNFPDLSNKREARFPIHPGTSQGIAVLKSGARLALPSATGDIKIFNSHDASLVTALRCPNTGKSPFHAVDGLSISNRDTDILVAACAREEESCIAVWCNMSAARHISTSVPSNSSTRLVIIAVLVYALCSSIQPLFIGLALTANGFSSVMQNRWQSTWTKPAIQQELTVEIIKADPVVETGALRPRQEPPDVDASQQEPEKTPAVGVPEVVAERAHLMVEVTPALEAEVEGSAIALTVLEGDAAHTIIVEGFVGDAA